MEAPPPSPSLSERTRRLEALEKWRGEVDGRIGDVEVRFSQLRQRYNKLCIAVEASQDVRKACKESVGNLQSTMQREITNLKEEIARKACKESVGNLQSTMQREITNLKKEIAQMKGTVDDDDEVVYVKTEPASSGRKRPRSIRLKI